MRVAAHNGATIWGGAERATVTLLRGLMDRGHEVLLLCNNDLVALRAADAGVPSRICVIGGDLSLPNSFRLAKVLRAYNPDAFIVGTYKKLFLASLGAKMAGVPRVVARVGLETDTPRSLKYRVALKRWTDGVAVNARRIIAPFASLDGFGPDKVALIHNGVRPFGERSGASLIRRQLGIDRNHSVIGTVARLAEQKRIDRLISAAKLLPESVHVIVAGDGEERQALEKQSAELGLAHRVHFLGNRDDTHEVLDAFDVFVMTSDREGLSNAMLEALSCGVPIVATHVSGVEEAIAADSDNPPAGLIADFSAESIASCIRSLIGDPERLAQFGRAGRDRARKRFSLDRMLDEWESFLFPRTIQP
jgi:glycosyltransferase involved in cell wall biosynthesis